MDGGCSSPMPNPCRIPALIVRSIALLDKMPDLGLGRGAPGPPASKSSVWLAGEKFQKSTSRSPATPAANHQVDGRVESCLGHGRPEAAQRMNNPSILEAGRSGGHHTVLPLSLALAGRRHWTDCGMAPHARAAQRASCIEQQAYAVAVPAAVAIVISCSPLTTSGKARTGAREREGERELS
jgi:hypothetical protein